MAGADLAGTGTAVPGARHTCLTCFEQARQRDWPRRAGSAGRRHAARGGV